MTFALIVIDVQVDFFERQERLAAQRQRLVASINELVREFRGRRLPIIWIKQEYTPDLGDAPLAMRKQGIRITITGTPGSEIVPELNRMAMDQVVVKKRFSAFFNTDLAQILRSLAPVTLVLAGINSHACVRMTAIDAYMRDLEVVIAEDCVASYDDHHHEVTMRYLGDGIAQVLDNDQILRLLGTA